MNCLTLSDLASSCTATPPKLIQTNNVHVYLWYKVAFYRKVCLFKLNELLIYCFLIYPTRSHGVLKTAEIIPTLFPQMFISITYNLLEAERPWSDVKYIIPYFLALILSSKIESYIRALLNP